tara:strand:+ start:681 stop:920 length:240 start_codon:yes stop_codon:yes gene_type:complete
MNYIIVPFEFLEYVDFSKVKQTNPESLRYSIDKKKFLLKYEGEQPQFVFNITQDAIGLREYNHEEILEILKGSEWITQD